MGRGQITVQTNDSLHICSTPFYCATASNDQGLNLYVNSKSKDFEQKPVGSSICRAAVDSPFLFKQMGQ